MNDFKERFLNLAKSDRQMLINQLTIIQAASCTALDILLHENENEDEQCDHPEEARKDLSTMGCEHWVCRKCGYEYTKESGD